MRIIVSVFELFIGGLHRSHVGGQNKRKFVHKVCTKMAGNSQRGKISLFLYTNMAVMTSRANHRSILRSHLKKQGPNLLFTTVKVSLDWP